jgi:hypothetical protein
MGKSTYLPPRPSTAGPPLSGICATKPNAEVKAIHLKAMSVILTTQAEIETWLTAPKSRMRWRSNGRSLTTRCGGRRNGASCVDRRDNEKGRLKAALSFQLGLNSRCDVGLRGPAIPEEGEACELFSPSA